MPIKSSQITWRYVDGTGIVGALVPSNELGNVFSTLTGARNKAGAIDTRVLAVKNDHPTLTLTTVKVWFRYGDPRGAALGIALDPVGVTTGPVTAGIAPTTYGSPITEGTGLAVASLAPGQAFAVWIRRTGSNSTAVSPERNIITVTGTTPA